MKPRSSRATVVPRLIALVAVPVVLAGLAGCSGSDDEGGTAAASSGATSSAPSAEPSATVPEGPFGPGCALFPAEGPGNLTELATLPVGTAVGSNPQLSTLTAAVVNANLVDVVNTREDVTVLAPSNAAFDALGPEALPALLADVPRLTALLTHHVLPGRLAPDDLVGEHTTLLGDVVTVAGPAEAPTVAAEETVAAAAPATVVCGNVPTANATVYVIDQVLAPAA